MLLEGHLLFSLYHNFMADRKQTYRINIRRLFSSILKEAARNYCVIYPFIYIYLIIFFI